jgi:predicted porin
LGNPSTSVNNNGRNVATILNPSRADNVVQYTTPNFAGFTGALQYAPDENTADDFFGAAVNYNRGPVNVGVSYEWNKQRLSPNDQVNKTLSVGANYDFGFLKLLAAYQQVSDLRVSANGIAGGVAQRLVGEGARTLTIDDQDAWVAGVEVPIGKITRVALLYTTIDYEGVPTTAGQPSSYSLGKTALELKHDLSRRTFLYAAVSQASGDLSDFITAYRQYQIGFQHRF